MSNVTIPTKLFSSFDIMVVESGTELEVPSKNGGHETVIITDDDAIFLGGKCYMTPTMHERVKAEVKSMQRAVQ